jgi:hypothetical protein
MVGRISPGVRQLLAHAQQLISENFRKRAADQPRQSRLPPLSHGVCGFGTGGSAVRVGRQAERPGESGRHQNVASNQIVDRNAARAISAESMPPRRTSRTFSTPACPFAAGVPSGLSPPWLDTDIAETPTSTARFASSTRITPLSMNGPPHSSRSQAMLPRWVAACPSTRRRRRRSVARLLPVPPGWAPAGPADAGSWPHCQSQPGLVRPVGSIRTAVRRSTLPGSWGCPSPGRGTSSSRW